MEIFGFPVWLIFSLFVFLALLLLGYTTASSFMGFGPTPVEWVDENGVKYRAGKNMWDWLELAGPWSITAMVALFASSYSGQLQLHEQQIEQKRVEAEALQTYLDQMNHHLIEDKLRQSKEGSEPRIVARAQTLTVLEGLAPSRKSQVLRFLIEAKLVQSVDDKDPILSLSQANLQGVEIPGANLQGANLAGADLSNTTLLDADLRGAVLSAANLSNANLSTGVDKVGGTNLAYVDLNLANLGGADLRGAEGITKEQLEDQAKSLQGATLPNGHKYRE